MILPHVFKDRDEVVWIDDSGYRVIDLAREHLAHGWSAEVLQENHPDLDLAQIHAALAWFYDHEREMMEEMRHREKAIDKLFSEIGESALQTRMRLVKSLFEN